MCTLYANRVAADHDPESPVVILGYSFGCVIAHRVAAILTHQDVENCLILVDMEVAWPPAPTMLRVGAYEWLGGSIEAALLVARAFGHIEWAAAEGTKLLNTSAENRDEDYYIWRAYRTVRGAETGAAA